MTATTAGHHNLVTKIPICPADYIADNASAPFDIEGHSVLICRSGGDECVVPPASG